VAAAVPVLNVGLQVNEGGGDILPTELSHITKREAAHAAIVWLARSLSSRT
jgi:Na+-transporting NADH:ubiquinone oxidoreductase subunit NqrF